MRPLLGSVYAQTQLFRTMCCLTINVGKIGFQVFVNVPTGHTRRWIEESADTEKGETKRLNTGLNTGITLHIFSVEDVHCVVIYSFE